MKIIQKMAMAISLVTTTLVVTPIAPSMAEVPTLPNTGTYFIVNLSNEEALTAGQASMGQFVATREFTKAGLQKWAVKRKIDLKTNKPTNRYTISLAGEITGLNFQPHPVAEMQSLLSNDTSIFVLAPVESGFNVKSVAKNGDALRIHESPPSYCETRFAPSDGSDKFLWKFIPAEQ